MIEASTASARSCGVIRSIAAAVINFTGFAMGPSLPCECVRGGRRLRRGNGSEATERRFDRVVGAVCVDDPRRLIQDDLHDATALDDDLVL